MKSYQIKVTYSHKGMDKKVLELDFNDTPLAFIVDTFVLEKIMEIENPNLISIYPLIKPTSRGSCGERVPSNRDLMVLHELSHIEYELDGSIFHITT